MPTQGPPQPQPVDYYPGAFMEREIMEQPTRLEGLLGKGAIAITEIAHRIKESRPRLVLLAARGTSDHAALYAKYLIEIRLGIPAATISASTYTKYSSVPDLSGVLWLVISQSGTSSDLVNSTQRARELGALTVAITNHVVSPVGNAAELAIDILAGEELAVAATKSYTAQLLALWMLISAWHEDDFAPAQEVIAAAHRAVDNLGIIDNISERYRFAERFIFTGRGYSYPTVCEAALKIMETAYISAHAYSGADLLHGPLALVDYRTPVIVVAPQGVGGRSVESVVEKLLSIEADVRVFGVAGRAPENILIPTQAIREDLSPIVDIIYMQRLAFNLSLQRGINPDTPRGLKKVVKTL